MADDSSLAERAEAYLDGDLPSEEAAQFERELAKPEVARALAEALALRELLRTAGPAEPPPGLVDAVTAALLLGTDDARRTAAPRQATLRRLSVPLESFSSALLWPRLAYAGMPTAGGAMAEAGLGMARSAVSWVGALRLAMGPLAVLGGWAASQHRGWRSPSWRLFRGRWSR